jgi:hypothetical protein
MTREEQIRQASIEYTYKDRPMCIGGGTFSEVVDEMNRNYAFEEGAKWADSHPNKKLVYTKKELLDMGFGFDLNGNIVTPQEIEERSKKYIKYRKDKWVEKTCEWLEPIAEYIGHDSESIKESFKKYINGCD